MNDGTVVSDDSFVVAIMFLPATVLKISAAAIMLGF